MSDPAPPPPDPTPQELEELGRAIDTLLLGRIAQPGDKPPKD